MDTFVDSSWYFLRYCSPRLHRRARSTRGRRARVDAGRHLRRRRRARRCCTCCTRRFFTKVLHDMGMVDFVEPFSAQLNQGQVINQGKKMSKSLGNGVDLGEQLDEFGVDAVRLTLVFAGPPEDDIDWADMSPGGSLRFLQRAWRLSGDVDLRRRRRRRRPVTSRCAGPPHRTVHEAGELIDELPVQRDGRADHGAGERHPQGDRLRLRPGRPGGPRGRRGGRDHAVAGRAVHRRGDVGAAGPRADRRARRLAGRRPGAAGRGRRSPRSSRCRARCGPGWRSAPDIAEADLEALALADPAVVRARSRGARSAG